MPRIIAGSLRGRVLKTPRGRRTRPTASRVREAIFDVLTHHPTHAAALEGGRVADLFAGSGALGIEALSRGADFALFVEQDRAAVQALSENLSTLGLNGRATVWPQDVRRTLGRLAEAGPFQAVFLDPPYAETAETDRLLARFEPAALLAPQGLLLVERAAGEAPASVPGMDPPLVRRWGETEGHFYLMKKQPDPSDTP